MIKVQPQNSSFGAATTKDNLESRWTKQKEVTQMWMRHRVELVVELAQIPRRQCHKTSNVHTSWTLIRSKNTKMDKCLSSLRLDTTIPEQWPKMESYTLGETASSADLAMSTSGGSQFRARWKTSRSTQSQSWHLDTTMLLRSTIREWYSLGDEATVDSLVVATFSTKIK